MSDGGEALRSRFAPALVAVHDAALLLDAEGVVLEANVRARTEWGVQVGDAWDWIREGSWTERGLQDAGWFDGHAVTVRRAAVEVEVEGSSGWLVTFRVDGDAGVEASVGDGGYVTRVHGDFDALLDALPVLTWAIDNRGAVRAVRGTTVEELDAQTWVDRDFIHVFSSVWNVELETQLRAAQTGRPQVAHFDAWGRSWELHLQPLKGTAGGARRPVLACALDVSRSVRLGHALMEAQQLESIGALAGGLAHEINTPMQYLGDNLQFLQMVIERLDEAEALLRSDSAPSAGCVEALAALRLDFLRAEYPGAIRQSLEGIERVSDIVAALKASARPERSDRKPSDLNRIIDNALRLSENAWKYVARVERDFTSPLPPVSCEPSEITHAVLNLVMNAVEAIRATHAQGRAGCIRVRTFFDDEAVGLELEDDGGGIPEPLRAQVFDHFFTTKDGGVGRGQGLTIARAIFAGHHGGTLRLEVTEGVGTTFRATLPRA